MFRHSVDVSFDICKKEKKTIQANRLRNKTYRGLMKF